MASGSALQSLFSQKLDRALFATYFLGAVIPLMAFGYGVQRFALPAVEGDRLATTLILGSSAGVVVLSLAAFFALRRLSLNAVRRMDDDNERLAAILAASRELAVAPHVHAAAGLAAECAARLVTGAVVLLVRRSAEDKPYELCESAGEGAQEWVSTQWDEIVELAERATGWGEPTPVQPLGDGTAVALPLDAEEEIAGTLVMVSGGDSQGAAFTPEVLDALATLAGVCAAALHGAEYKDSQRNFFTHATEIMVMAIDSRDERHAGGCHAIARIANLIGRELELSDEALERMHFAALLADIGILKLSHAQQSNRDQRAKHPMLGHRILSRIRIWEPLAEIVLHHHDDFAASGEAAARVPIESRVIHVADAWAGLSREGANGTSLTPDGSLVELERQAGTRFDPRVVAAVRRLVERDELPTIEA